MSERVRMSSERCAELIEETRVALYDLSQPNQPHNVYVAAWKDSYLRRLYSLKSLMARIVGREVWA